VTPLAVIALDVGASALSKILRQHGGRAGTIAADVAEAAIRQVADTLGVEPTEEAIAARYESAPEVVSEAFQAVEQDLGPIARAASEATQSYQQLMAGDRASPSMLTRIWRPLNGILFALSCLALVLSFCILMLKGDVQTIANASVAYGFLGTVLGTWAGVVGVYVWRRSDEKTSGGA